MPPRKKRNPMQTSLKLSPLSGNPFHPVKRVKSNSCLSSKFATEKRFQGFSILFVEDDVFNQHLTGLILHRAGCRCSVAGDGREALDLMKSNRFDLILMDISMPVMDGLEATKIIRQEMRLQVPIIAITGDVLAEDLHRYKQAGMNAHLAKPYNQQQLISLIARWCSE
jgi:CheY-like chemotaxis protein